MSVIMRILMLCFVLGACSSSHRGEGADAGPRGPDAGVAPDAPPAEVDSGPEWLDAGELVSDAGDPMPDAGDAMPDAGDAERDAGPIRAGTIACGTTECALETEGCLASCVDARDARTPACLPAGSDRWSPPGDCPSGREQFPRYWLRCDGAEDCPAGERCHVIRGSLGQYAYCDACGEGCDIRYFEPLCRRDADCPAEVPRCLPSDLLPGYATCGE
jgi:hypothetical protein